MHEDRVGLHGTQHVLPVAGRPAVSGRGAAEHADLAGMVGLAEIAGDACVDVRLVSHGSISWFQFFFATSGHSPWSIGRNASSPDIVEISL